MSARKFLFGWKRFVNEEMIVLFVAGPVAICLLIAALLIKH